MGMRQEAHGPRWGSQLAWASEALQTPQQASDTEGLWASFWSLRSAICRVIKLPPLSSRVEPNREVSGPCYTPASAPQSGPWVRG